MVDCLDAMDCAAKANFLRKTLLSIASGGVVEVTIEDETTRYSNSNLKAFNMLMKMLAVDCPEVEALIAASERKKYGFGVPCFSRTNSCGTNCDC